MRRLLLVVALFLAVAAPASAMRVLDGDTTPPVISGMPSSFSVEATSSAGATATYATPTANDDVDGAVPVNCVPGSGAQFPLGGTVVTCSAQDLSGNTASESFTITVVDTTSPSLVNMPSSFSIEATSPGGTPATYTSPTATDSVDPNPTVGCSPASGSSFALGSNTVTCTATDASSNSSQASLTITVTDTTKPVLVGMPSSFSTEATSPAGTVVTYTAPSATDNGDPSPSVTCAPASGSTFPLGATPVSCTAQDTNGNTSDPAGFTITVTDTTSPVLVGLPASFSVEATSPSGAVATYTAPTATDNADPAPTVNCVPASGGTFPFGGTSVACTARDNRGNQAVGNFTITVADTTAPVFSGFGDKTVEANGPTGSNVNFPTPRAFDTVDGLIAAVTCAPASGSKFPLGKTAVTCSASDVHGNVGQAKFNVTVADTTPPNLIIPVARSVYASSPDGIPKTAATVVSFLSAASATDIVDQSPVITNNAPSLLPVGTTTSSSPPEMQAATQRLGRPRWSSCHNLRPARRRWWSRRRPTIPAQARNVKVTPLDGAARIQWNADGRKVMVTRSTSATRSLSAVGDERVVYTGNGSSYTDRGLRTAWSTATSSWRSTPQEITPPALLPSSSRDGTAQVTEGRRAAKKAPKLVWARRRGAVLQRPAAPERQEDPQRVAGAPRIRAQEELEVRGPEIHAQAWRLHLVRVARLRRPPRPWTTAN